MEPAELMLVAAYPWTWRRLAGPGCYAFVDRPLEYGPGSGARAAPAADESVTNVCELLEFVEA
jgi:hypothetical protein